MYALAMYHPLTNLVITTLINLTQQHMEVHRELAERGGFKGKVCKDRSPRRGGHTRPDVASTALA